MKKIKITKYSKSIYDTLMQAYRPYMAKIGATLIFGFFGRFLLLSNIQVIGQYIDQHEFLTAITLRPLFFKIATLLIIAFSFTIFFRTVFSRLSALAVSRIYDETTYRVSRFPISFFESQPVGKITTRFSSDYGNMFRLFGGPLAEFLSIFFDLVSIVILMVFVHLSFIFTILGSTWLYFILLKRNQHRLRSARREMSTNRAPSVAHFSETVQGATIIRENQKQKMFTDKFLEYDDKYLKSKWAVFWHVTRFSLELNVLSTILFGLNGLICLYLMQTGVIGVGQSGVILSLTLLATYTLQMFFEWFSQFEEALTGVEKLDEYIRAPLEPGMSLPAYSDFSTSHPKKLRPTHKKDEIESLDPGHDHIQVENLFFKYPTNNEMILNSISFRLKKGDRLGIIGRTGSGKTTLISALLHLYPIHSGVVLINGKNEVDVEKHRSLFSVISQDQLFMTGTIRDNLDLFRHRSNQEIEKILKQVGIPFKLTDHVSEKGQNLSQGEKQLLSLARGLLQNAQIFIFDEATSNVDPQSEALMNRALKDVLGDKTQIRIAHRLQTVEDCHQILWLDAGHVKKIGPPQEVLVAFKQ
ncbi:MAG: ABC transporter ATP-binding protein [Bdellovibrionaceae bacterium]|nr:ABC transporter ATP-binding protein [Bdellovibrio sp.]